MVLPFMKFCEVIKKTEEPYKCPHKDIMPKYILKGKNQNRTRPIM